MIKELLFRKAIDKAEKKTKKSSILKDMISDPDSMMLTAYVENGELIIRIKRHDVNEAESTDKFEVSV